MKNILIFILFMIPGIVWADVEHEYSIPFHQHQALDVTEFVPRENPTMVCIVIARREHWVCIPRATTAEKRTAGVKY